VALVHGSQQRRDAKAVLDFDLSPSVPPSAR
jgi:hypothetical protein